MQYPRMTCFLNQMGQVQRLAGSMRYTLLLVVYMTIEYSTHDSAFFTPFRVATRSWMILCLHYLPLCHLSLNFIGSTVSCLRVTSLMIQRFVINTLLRKILITYCCDVTNVDANCYRVEMGSCLSFVCFSKNKIRVQRAMWRYYNVIHIHCIVTIYLLLQTLSLDSSGGNSWHVFCCRCQLEHGNS